MSKAKEIILLLLFSGLISITAHILCTLHSIQAPVGQIAQQSPPLDDHDDYVNDDNDDDDDDV